MEAAENLLESSQLFHAEMLKTIMYGQAVVGSSTTSLVSTDVSCQAVQCR